MPDMWGKFFCLFGVASHGTELKHAVSGREKVDFHLYKYLILAAGKQEIHIQIFSCNFVTVQTCTLNILFWIQTFPQLTGYLVWLSLTVSYLVLLWLSSFVNKKKKLIYSISSIKLTSLTEGTEGTKGQKATLEKQPYTLIPLYQNFTLGTMQSGRHPSPGNRESQAH